jgi:hypothetical protein
MHSKLKGWKRKIKKPLDKEGQWIWEAEVLRMKCKTKRSTNKMPKVMKLSKVKIIMKDMKPVRKLNNDSSFNMKKLYKDLVLKMESLSTNSLSSLIKI